MDFQASASPSGFPSKGLSILDNSDLNEGSPSISPVESVSNSIKSFSSTSSRPSNAKSTLQTLKHSFFRRSKTNIDSTKHNNFSVGSDCNNHVSGTDISSISNKSNGANPNSSLSHHTTTSTTNTPKGSISRSSTLSSQSNTLRNSSIQSSWSRSKNPSLIKTTTLDSELPTTKHSFKSHRFSKSKTPISSSSGSLTESLIKSRASSSKSFRFQPSDSFQKYPTEPCSHQPTEINSGIQSSRRNSRASFWSKDSNPPVSHKPNSESRPANISSVSLDLPNHKNFIGHQVADHLPKFSRSSFNPFSSRKHKHNQSFPQSLYDSANESVAPCSADTKTSSSSYSSCSPNPQSLVLSTSKSPNSSTLSRSPSFVIATADLLPQGPHGLHLARGDIIRLNSRLNSGWADGTNSRNQRGWFPFNLTVAYDSPDSSPPSPKHVLDLISNFKPTANLPLEKIPNVAPSEFPAVSQESGSAAKNPLDQNSSVSPLALKNSKCLDATNSASTSPQHDFQIRNLQQSCTFPTTSLNSSPFDSSATTSSPPTFHSFDSNYTPSKQKSRPSDLSTSAEPTSSIDPTSLSPNSEQDKSHGKSPIFSPAPSSKALFSPNPFVASNTLSNNLDTQGSIPSTLPMRADPTQNPHANQSTIRPKVESVNNNSELSSPAPALANNTKNDNDSSNCQPIKSHNSHIDASGPDSENSNNPLDTQPANDLQYKFVDGKTLLHSSDSKPDSNTQTSDIHEPNGLYTYWNPFSNDQARLFYYNPELNLVTDDLPFRKVSPQQADLMSSKGLPVKTAGSGDLKAIESCLDSFGISGAGKSSTEEETNDATVSQDCVNKDELNSRFLLDGSGDPYKELLSKHYQNYDELCKDRANSIDSVNSGMSLASNMLIPFKYLDGIENLKTWPAIVNRLETSGAAMTKALENHDHRAIQHGYDVLTALVANVSYLSGIPPGTVPSFASINRELSRSYRRMMTATAKFALSFDFTKDKGPAFLEYTKTATDSLATVSPIFSETKVYGSSHYYTSRKFSVISELSESDNLDAYHFCSRDVNTLVKVIKMYIKCFKGIEKSHKLDGTAVSHHGAESSPNPNNAAGNVRRPSIVSQQSAANIHESPAMQPLVNPAFTEVINDDSHSVRSRGSVDSAASLSYPVRQFRAGTWSHVSVNTPSLHPSTTGYIRVPRRQSIVPLESFDSFIPLDHEAVAVLEYQRGVVLNILKQIFSLVENVTHNEGQANEEQKDDFKTRESLGGETDSSILPGQHPNNAASKHLPEHVSLNDSTKQTHSHTEHNSFIPFQNNRHNGFKQMSGEKLILFISSLNSLIATVTNICNLLDSLDLSLYQPLPSYPSTKSNERAPSMVSRSGKVYYQSAQQRPNKDVHLTIMLYDFLNVKQVLRDELLAFLYATGVVDFESENFVSHFAELLDSVKVSNSYFQRQQEQHLREEDSATESGQEDGYESPHAAERKRFDSEPVPTAVKTLKKTINEYEGLIKTRAMSIGVSVDVTVTMATMLANERQSLVLERRMSVVDSSTRCTRDPVFKQKPTDEFSDSKESVVSNNSTNSVARNRSLSSTPQGKQGSGPSNSLAHKDSKYWFLMPDYEQELIYDSDDTNTVRGGTLRALIEHLTQHNSRDSAFNIAFLLTFRTMLHPSLFFKLLAKRYGVQPPAGLSTEDFAIWTERLQKPVRFRVTNILKRWLTEYWFEDPNNPAIEELLKSMKDFSVELERQKSPGFQQIRTQIELKLQKNYTSQRRLVQNSPSKPLPVPILPKNEDYQLLDLDPLELARQLCILEHNLFEKITPYECLTRRQSRSKVVNNTLEGTPHIDAFIHNSNCLTSWVCSVILSHGDASNRAKAIEYYTSVAEYCRQFNDFSSMMAIISAISSATIHRLKKTWELVSAQTSYLLDSMNKLMNSSRNFNEYRDILSVVTPPAIPFFGVYLTDLVFLEDANQDYLVNINSEVHGLSRQRKDALLTLARSKYEIINFSKRMKAAAIVRDIMNYQSAPYQFKEIPKVQAMLESSFSEVESVDTQYELSLKLEPREGVDDRISKLLKQTGYT